MVVIELVRIKIDNILNIKISMILQAQLLLFLNLSWQIQLELFIVINYCNG